MTDVLSQSASPSVTIVDDEPYARDVLLRYARSWHYECQLADTAERAVALLERHPTPVVITDLRMPGRGGLWLIGEVRRRWPCAYVIVLTAGHDPDAGRQCSAARADHYFLKPVDRDELRHALEAALRAHRREEESRARHAALERQLGRQKRRDRDALLGMIASHARTLAARDPYTAGHSRRVRAYALRLADALGLSARQRCCLDLAARLHDIGKVRVPDAILHKPAALTEAEMAVVRAHPAVGESILAPVIRQPEVLAAVRGHHERFDGAGYPDGLAGDHIPLLARLIAVPDTFDALTTRRPYRDALPAAAALAVLERGAGNQFDPELVHAFLRIAPKFKAG